MGPGTTPYRPSDRRGDSPATEMEPLRWISRSSRSLGGCTFSICTCCTRPFPLTAAPLDGPAGTSDRPVSCDVCIAGSSGDETIRG